MHQCGAALAQRAIDVLENELAIQQDIAAEQALHAQLVEQVVGAFVERDGETIFVGHGEEVYRDEPRRMRFVWRDIGPASARWEQAYWDPGREEWETNWVMEFSRVEDV